MFLLLAHWYYTAKLCFSLKVYIKESTELQLAVFPLFFFLQHFDHHLPWAIATSFPFSSGLSCNIVSITGSSLSFSLPDFRNMNCNRTFFKYSRLATDFSLSWFLSNLLISFLRSCRWGKMMKYCLLHIMKNWTKVFRKAKKLIMQLASKGIMCTQQHILDKNPVILEHTIIQSRNNSELIKSIFFDKIWAVVTLTYSANYSISSIKSWSVKQAMWIKDSTIL